MLQKQTVAIENLAKAHVTETAIMQAISVVSERKATKVIPAENRIILVEALMHTGNAKAILALPVSNLDVFVRRFLQKQTGEFL